MASRTIRFKLYALLSLPIVALVALWAFVTGYVVGDFFELRQASTLYEQVSAPATALAIEVQQERRFSAIQLSSATDQVDGLPEARGRTDKAVTEFVRHTTALETTSVLDPALGAAISEVSLQAEKLRTIRGDVDGRTVNRLQAVEAFSDITDAVYRLQDQVVTVSEIGLYQQAVGLQRISHAQDLLSRENALISGATLAGQLTHAEYEAIEVLAPNRRLLLSEGVAALDDELSGPFKTLVVSPGYRGLVALEVEIVEESKLPFDKRAWQPIADAFSSTTDKFLTSRGALLNERTDATAGGIIAQIIIAGGLGLAAILGAVILSAKLGRRLAEELGHLRMTALELAEVRLPQVVERLRRGESVDVKADAPPIPTTGTTLEITDVARAFSTVQSTAVEAAVGEARLRHGFNRVFRNLARRNQSLVHRQLTQLDSMQRKTSEPEVLEDLYRLDHLTTRMRRQSEGLIILSGATAGRTWRNPVPLLDVVRAAVAEVEDYKRINVLPMPDAKLTGTATADVTHLLAELLENATVFSPPTTPVSVRGGIAGRGFVVEVEDRGLGLQVRECEAINERLASPPAFDVADSEQLGLFVVSQLAARHGIKVTLNRSPFGGTTAVVFIPQTVLTAAEEVSAATAYE
ncbi:Histidine kinase-, DNA gyrase B-, and HSP90-like ATPase [Streptosporangium subroseum]|uniref:histidine kinase n=1 Tax=Streptosporangium subroseum TaxID=106412 RepID=A0A239MZM2_9ACTN|nr:nitrate- and nitrite sensing domain-containing protein [Streptosporangium subroseum]SNT47683.1 Histidine kinase-, DNA gyrase B-, and HSP90-like ATPase [Streptosporangium subroseum]